ncbi:flagellar basal-body MS-ring/collar protein FliF [Arthrobacter oryzae]|uniref:Flagellar M-ring protein n=1 Tax=Arthrobacter oryzae TaxID=409290 RepID=A0A495E9Q5_9MICC|nr:flagellar basal-body MS-ring/collar protein FliF [Arthrobacter oryzae]RKR13615.1 flagellar M-ring protein FliF [Arthrobacter oryzae]
MPPQINVFFQRFGAGLKSFTAGQRTLAVLGAALLVVGIVALSAWLTRPALTPLFSGLKSTDASGIVDQLKKDNVAYELSDGGSTILVPQDKVYDERLKAASAGLPTAAATGYSLLDKMGVTSSEFQQSVTYKRALEGELASTIEAMDGVKTAAVRLAIPDKSVFVSKTPDTTASVFIDTAAGATLSSDKVQAIVHLTSAAIENLKPDNVSVVDSQGNVLSTVGGGATGSTSKQASDYENRTSDAVKAVLDRVVGPGNSTVAVAADVTGESAQQKSETFSNTAGALPLSESSKTEKYTGTGGGAAGVLGPDNIAVPSGTSGNGNFDSTTATKNNAVNKVTEDRLIPAGAVKRQTISVGVSQAAAGGLNLASLKNLVTSAAGVDTTRGDVVTVEVVPFSTAAADNAAKALAEAQANAEAEKQAAFFSTIITAGSILLGLLILALVVTIILRRRQKREPVDLGERLDLQIMPVAPPVVALPPAPETSAIPITALPPLPGPSTEQLESERRRVEIDSMVAANPERAADYLRSLMDDRQPA